MRLIEDIAVDMGQLFMTQDDFLDCFGDPEITGRFATKIQGNACTWFIIKALSMASPEQEKILKVSKESREMITI